MRIELEKKHGTNGPTPPLDKSSLGMDRRSPPTRLVFRVQACPPRYRSALLKGGLLSDFAINQKWNFEALDFLFTTSDNGRFLAFPTVIRLWSLFGHAHANFLLNFSPNAQSASHLAFPCVR